MFVRVEVRKHHGHNHIPQRPPSDVDNRLAWLFEVRGLKESCASKKALDKVAVQCQQISVFIPLSPVLLFES